MSQAKIILVAGPTASGKSALALDLARKFHGTIINADAMQIYAGLPILTAQPTEADRRDIPHELYGILPPTERSSAGRWLELARAAIERAVAAGRTPIVTGGTGLYFRALLGGLADIPPIPDEARGEAQRLYDEIGEEKFRSELAKLDPDSAARLARNDRQRMARAYEVAKHTGRTLGEWQRQGLEARGLRLEANVPLPLAGGVRGGPQCQTPSPIPAIPPPLTPPPHGGGGGHSLFAFEISDARLLMPPREQLYAACDNRFAEMIKNGAIDEVRAFLKLGVPPDLPAAKTIGVREIAAFLEGKTSREEAIAAAQQATRNYAKRQMTWFRNQWKNNMIQHGHYG